jgi:hypothetical protein
MAVAAAAAAAAAPAADVLPDVEEEAVGVAGGDGNVAEH